MTMQNFTKKMPCKGTFGMKKKFANENDRFKPKSTWCASIDHHALELFLSSV